MVSADWFTRPCRWTCLSLPALHGHPPQPHTVLVASHQTSHSPDKIAKLNREAGKIQRLPPFEFPATDREDRTTSPTVDAPDAVNSPAKPKHGI